MIQLAGLYRKANTMDRIQRHYSFVFGPLLCKSASEGLNHILWSCHCQFAQSICSRFLEVSRVSLACNKECRTMVEEVLLCPLFEIDGPRCGRFFFFFFNFVGYLD